jgi:hypothetical protein
MLPLCKLGGEEDSQSRKTPHDDDKHCKAVALIGLRFDYKAGLA